MALCGRTREWSAAHPLTGAEPLASLQCPHSFDSAALGGGCRARPAAPARRGGGNDTRPPVPPHRGTEAGRDGGDARGSLLALRPGRGGAGARLSAAQAAARPRLRLCPCPAGTGRPRARGSSVRQREPPSSSSSSSPPPPAPSGGNALPGPPVRAALRGRADKGCGLVPALGRDGAARRLRRLGGAEPSRAGQQHMVRGWGPALRTRGRAEGPPWTTSWRR